MLGECRKWPGPFTTKGYGVVHHNGKRLQAHRWIWEQANGPIPKGMCVLHHCDVRNCIELSHLFLGTVADNNKDRAKKGRTKNQNTSKTHCPKGHEYSGVRDGRRICRTCETANAQRSWDRKKGYAE